MDKFDKWFKDQPTVVRFITAVLMVIGLLLLENLIGYMGSGN